MRRLSSLLVTTFLAVSVLRGADGAYRTPETAITAKVQAVAPAGGPAAYLGVHIQQDPTGRLFIDDVQPESPAEKGGVKTGDMLARVDGKVVSSPDAFKDALRAKTPGNDIKLSLTRAGKSVEVSATLTALSRPMPVGRVRQPTSLGVQVVPAKEGDGVTIEQVVPGSLADKAKLKVGETILKIDDTALTGPDKLREILSAKKPDDTLTLTLLVAEKRVEMKVKLEPPGDPGRRTGGPLGGGWNRGYWTRPGYTLAIILVEYPDVKHNKDIPPEAWEKSMFSKGQTWKKTPTGQDAFGSMYDYYLEQSYGHLKIEGKAFPYVEVSKKRDEYGTAGNNRSALLTEALDKLLARDGKDALKDFDGVFFIYAGGRMTVPRGSLYWPHRARVNHSGSGKSWDYFICPEGGQRMANISVFCHEFGHMLGLPDLYARPENPGMEGLDIWCAMANQAGNGRPQHFSAWPKEKLGWIKPAVIDPTVKQKIALAPIETSPKECVKVLVRPDGSEYFLLEHRAKKGFDTSLPSEGLLIWRVVGNRPILEESHGVNGAVGPRVFRDYVPFPSDSNKSFTPLTTPSSRSQLGGGLPVWITNIERLPDGRIGFHVGYEYQ